MIHEVVLNDARWVRPLSAQKQQPKKKIISQPWAPSPEARAASAAYAANDLPDEDFNESRRLYYQQKYGGNKRRLDPRIAILAAKLHHAHRYLAQSKCKLRKLPAYLYNNNDGWSAWAWHPGRVPSAVRIIQVAALSSARKAEIHALVRQPADMEVLPLAARYRAAKPDLTFAKAYRAAYKTSPRSKVDARTSNNRYRLVEDQHKRDKRVPGGAARGAISVTTLFRHAEGALNRLIDATDEQQALARGAPDIKAAFE